MEPKRVNYLCYPLSTVKLPVTRLIGSVKTMLNETETRVVIFASYYIYGSCVFKVPCYKKIEYIKILYFLMNIMKYFQKVLYFRYFIHFCVLPFYIFFVLPFIRSVYTK